MTSKPQNPVTKVTTGPRGAKYIHYADGSVIRIPVMVIKACQARNAGK